VAGGSRPRIDRLEWIITHSDNRTCDSLTMRLPRVQFTVRTMMAAVAIAGLVFAFAGAVREMWRRQVEYEVRSLAHSIAAYPHRYGAWPEGRVPLWPARPLPQPDARKLAYHDAMSRKWSEAARHPWLSIEPDPFPP
jgi:hypothetical protein